MRSNSLGSACIFHGSPWPSWWKLSLILVHVNEDIGPPGSYCCTTKTSHDDGVMKFLIGQLCTPQSSLGQVYPRQPRSSEIISILLGLDRVQNTRPIIDGHHVYGHPSGLWEAAGSCGQSVPLTSHGPPDWLVATIKRAPQQCDRVDREGHQSSICAV